MKQYLKWFGFVAVSLCLPVINTTSAHAFAHYVPGTLGVKNASVPPVGLWWEDYNQLYWADTIMDDNGDEIPGLGTDLTVYANVFHAAWMTEKQILGADYGVDIFVPLVYTDFQMASAGIDEDTFGLGDIFIDPLVLGWHGNRYDAFLSAGAYMPTGDYGDASSPGKGYWTFMEQAGVTYYVDEARTWSGSIRARLLQSTEDPDTDVTPGDELFFEYGVGKSLPLSANIITTLGVGGYSYWQTSADSGPDTDGNKAVSHAVGPDIQFTFLKPFLNVAIRYLTEYGVENGTEGDTFSVVLGGSF